MSELEKHDKVIANLLVQSVFDKDFEKRIEEAAYVAVAAGGEYPKKVRNHIAKHFQDNVKLKNIYEKLLFADAHSDFDCFCRYLEWDIYPKGFYAPRRKYLMPVVNALQDLYDGKTRLLIIRLPARTGKTSIANKFNLWISGKKPTGSILAGGANADVCEALYNRFLKDYRDYEKRFLSLFPKAVIKKKSVLDMSVRLATAESMYPTFLALQTSGDAGRQGVTQASNLIYLDDTMQSGYTQHAVEKSWEYGVRAQVLSRITRSVPILCVGTSYGVDDHQERLIKYASDKGYDYKVIAIPALNEKNESNFECTVYDEEDGEEGVQLTTDYFVGEKLSLSHNAVGRARWAAEYMCSPIPLEGFMFPFLLRYSENEERVNKAREAGQQLVLKPSREPDTTLCFVDCAFDGKDSTCCMILDVYADKDNVAGYVRDIMHDRSGSVVTVPKLCEFLIRNKILSVTIEANAGSASYADTVSHRLQNEYKYLCKVKKQTANSNKHARIESGSATVLTKIYFKDINDYVIGSEYGNAVDEVMKYTVDGMMVKHDDAPDVISALAADMIQYAKRYSQRAAVTYKRFF